MSRQGAGTSVPAPLAYPAACWAGLLGVPVGGGPPASRPRRELCSARRLEARPGPATAHRHRGRSLRRPPHQWGRVCWRVDWCVVSKPGQAPPPPTGTAARPCRCLSMSHVIPLRLVQTLNLNRWNCSVFVWSRKVTVGNYVRLLVSAGLPAAFCAAAGPRVLQPGRALRRPPLVCVVWIGSSVLDRNGASG